MNLYNFLNYEYSPLTRKALADCLNRLKSWHSNSNDVMKDKDFVYYHLNRNFFNNKYGANEAEGGRLTFLTQTGSGFSDTFVDNLGRKWTEASWMGIQYHQTPEEHKKDFWLSHREWVTRKFYSADEHMAAAGYGGCESELVIWGGMRLVSRGYMETYNFGHYGIWSTVGYNGLQGKFDVKSYKVNQKYETKYYFSNKVSITDSAKTKFFLILSVRPVAYNINLTWNMRASDNYRPHIPACPAYFFINLSISATPSVACILTK